MYSKFSHFLNILLLIETVITNDESKNNKVDEDYSFQSTDGRMSKSEIKIARQSQRKRYTYTSFVLLN